MPVTLEPVKRGDHGRVLRITATWPEDAPEFGAAKGDPYPLTGKTLYFTAKLEVEDADEDAVFQKSNLTGGGITPGLAAHQALITLYRSDTVGLTESANLKCDLQVTDAAANLELTVWDGVLPVKVDVTRTSALT